MNRRALLAGIAGLPLAEHGGAALKETWAPSSYTFRGVDLAVPVSERTVVFLAANGHVYAFDGRRVLQW